MPKSPKASRSRTWLWLTLCFLIGTRPPVMAAAGFLVPASPETKTAFLELFPADAKVEVLAEGLKFTEGPVWIPALEGQPGYLLFSDIPANVIYRWTPETGAKPWREPSFKANGNTFDAKTQRLLTAEHDSRVVTQTRLPGGEREVIIAETTGKKFNSPNDLVLKSDGSIWFTDPAYGLGKRPSDLGHESVWHWMPGEDARVVAGEAFEKPNGLAFSPDETRLYIADSGKNRIMVYDVEGDSLTNGQVLAVDIHADGMRVDTEGRLWSSAQDGVRVFAPDGTWLGTVRTEQQPANLELGGPEGTDLFMTSRTALYRLATSVRKAPVK